MITSQETSNNLKWDRRLVQLARHYRTVEGICVACKPKRRRLGDEQYFLVIPVDEDMTRRRDDVGGATIQERNDLLSF
jgi:hypothetical protein